MQHHVPSSSPFSVLLVSVNRLLSCTRFPAFFAAYHPFVRPRSFKDGTITAGGSYCRESAIAWDHTLSLLSLYLKKKKGWSQVTAAMPRLFQAFRWWRRPKEMSAQKLTGGRVGGQSKGTSSLSSSLSLSSSFFFTLSYFALHSPTSTPGTGYVPRRIYLCHSVLLSI